MSKPGDNTAILLALRAAVCAQACRQPLYKLWVSAPEKYVFAPER